MAEPKKKLSKSEILDILRRNARLFKEEPDFVNYIVDLAIYLIETNLEEIGEGSVIGKDKTSLQASKKELKEALRVFDRFSTGTSLAQFCPMCGADTEGKRKCPNCNAMTF
jgi:hypothetical protein